MTKVYQTLKDKSFGGNDGNCLHEFHCDVNESDTDSLVEAFELSADGASSMRDLGGISLGHTWTTVGGLKAFATSYKGDCSGCSAAYKSTLDPSSTLGQRSDDCPVLHLTAKLLSEAETKQLESNGTVFHHLPEDTSKGTDGGAAATQAMLDAIGDKLTGNTPEKWEAQVSNDPDLRAAYIDMAKSLVASSGGLVSHPDFDSKAQRLLPDAMRIATIIRNATMAGNRTEQGDGSQGEQ